LASFNTTLRQMTEIFQWPKRLNKKKNRLGNWFLQVSVKSYSRLWFTEERPTTLFPPKRKRIKV